jgi:hypothetical protein
MAELRNELLVEYVDEQTPEQAPPFTGVERGARRRKRQRNLLAVATVVAVATVATVVTQDVRRGAEPAGAPTVGVLDDGPPPARFKFGNYLMLLQTEIPVTAVRPLPGSPSVLVVEAPRPTVSGEGCSPQTMVRILDQDATTARIAAYRYVVAPDEPGGECLKAQTGPVQIQLDLRTAIGTRRIIAGTTGERVLLN